MLRYGWSNGLGATGGCAIALHFALWLVACTATIIVSGTLVDRLLLMHVYCKNAAWRDNLNALAVV